MIYTMPTIISISSIPFILRPSTTVAGLLILRLLMWIYHLIFSISVISIIFNTRNYWIDFNDIGFDNVYPFPWYWPAETNFIFLSADIGFWLALFVVVDRYNKFSLWSWSNATSTSEGVFLCSFTASIVVYILKSVLV